MKSRNEKKRRREEAAARAVAAGQAGGGDAGGAHAGGAHAGGAHGSGTHGSGTHGSGVRAGGADRGSPPSDFARPSLTAIVVGVALLAVFAVQALVAAHRDSVTIDEYVHLPVGLHALHTGDLRQDPINTHVPRMLAALALADDPPVFAPPPDAAVWGLGGYFMEANVDAYQTIYERARRSTIVLALLAALVMAKWTFELYGSGAALVALALFAFSPSLLAHGHLVTLDMAGVLGFVLALYANWRFLAAPSWRLAALLGVTIGAANLLKLSGSVLVAMILATWAIRVFAERRGPRSSSRTPTPTLAAWVGLLAVCGSATLATLNLGYGFDGTFDLLRNAALAPGGKLDSLAGALPWLRLPLPQAFVNGMDMAMEVGKGQEPSYFLAGELSADGWWYYHLAAFAGKCPLPVLLAALFSLGAWLAGFSRGTRDYAVFVPVVLLFAANSMLNSLAIGERHVLAVYPLLFVGMAPWLVAGLSELGSVALLWRGSARVSGSTAALALGSAAALASVTVLLWTGAGTLAVAPRYLQFFNEAVGGPERGHRYLIDSNIDWGQDLIRLREYMDANKLDTVSLAYFGRVHPAVYDIGFTPLERGQSHGITVVSATFLMGRPYFWYLGGRMRWVPARTYEWLQGYKPIARVGSMFVFDLP